MIFDRFRKKETPGPAKVPGEGDPCDESTDFLTGNPEVDRRSLHLLLDTMAEVGSTIELGQLLIDLVDKSIEATQSERGFLLLSEREGGPVEVRVARAAGKREIPLEATYSTSVATKVLETGQPVANIVQSTQDALDLGQSVYDLKLRAVMCVPLEAQGRMSGVIYVDSKAERQDFTNRDLAFFAALAQQLAISLENARLYNESLERVRLSKELELARKIQEQLLPNPRGLSSAVEAETWFRPAEAASGDTFDVVTHADGGVAVLLGDVSGHGIASALIAHSVQAALRSYLEVLTDVGEVMRRLNARFTAGIETGSFMSMMVARVWPDGDALRVQHVNAGHGCSWIIRSSGVETIDIAGPALGMVPEFDYVSSDSVMLGRGDLLFLCSDGVTEARNAARDMLGEARLIDVLASMHGKGPAALVGAVRECLEQFVGGVEFEDDVMLLALAMPD